MRFLSAVFFIVFILFQISFAQIPNPSFESWTNGDPNGWFTGNTPPVLVPITQTNDAHAGTSAVKGSVIDFQGFGFITALISGDGAHGFPYDQRADALHGWYKFNSVGGDSLIMTVAFSKNGVPIGSGQAKATSSVSLYTEFVANTLWFSNDTPDTAYIVFVIANSNGTSPHVGSYYIIDDLSFGNSTGVENLNNVPNNFYLGQNYPNPFNPSTTISFSIPEEDFVSLKVFNSLGEEVATLVNEIKPSGKYSVSFDASNLTSGVYFYKIKAGKFIGTKKMILIK
jgi:Secretion system C-terminal sorting domain